MNKFEQALVEKIGEARLAQIQKVTVGIAGAGGLGSNCALFLVRSGFARFKIVDYAAVDWSDLNRQFYFGDQIGEKKVTALQENLRRVNPDLVLETPAVRINPENVKSIFADCDIVIEALNEGASKALLMETYGNSGKLFICASGTTGWGNSANLITRRIANRVFLIGDLRTTVNPDYPAMAPRMTVAAAKAANIVLSWVIGEADNPAELEIGY
ncbi:MAG: sulfur carrier protein ThiS adenylyltransferase ThiF [Heliobacteriaceae bacterium]|nr:sulfur carrier protein ThiS adenylyltransferase ThiF [Heliobacteriaceae bacterium]